MKTRMLFGLLIAVLVTQNLAAQNYLAMARPEGSKNWGYIDETGKMIIKPQYRDCYSFSPDGYAIIEEKRKHQFIDTKGKILETGFKKFYLKEFSFGFSAFGGSSLLLSFDDGLVPIRERKSYGFLKTDGKLEIEMKYDNVSGFRDGHAYAIAKNKFYIIDTKGKESPIKASDITEIKRPSEKMAAYRGKDKLMGFVDMNGEVVIKAQFDAVGPFMGGLAWARDKKNLVGFINKKGEWAIKAQFAAAKNFDPIAGVARVKDSNGDWAYIKKDGSTMKLKIKTEVYGVFVEGLAKGRVGKKFGFFGSDGNWVIKPQFDAVGKISNGYIAAREGKLWGFVDMEGNWVIKPKFEGIRKMVKIK